MDRREFFSMYLPALEIALENDHINYGFLVMCPDFYVDREVSNQMDRFIEEELLDDHFVNFVAYYFDAMSHNFPDVGKVSIEEGRAYIFEEMKRLRTEYNL